MSARILVLEDDQNMRQMLAMVLEKEGYQVEAAGTGLEAVQLAAQSAFDLVIVDIRMEGIDGLEALARVRESQPEVRSLVVTGYSTEADSIRAIRLGVGDYLKKPFDLKEFLGAVRRLLVARRQEQERAEHESRLVGGLLRTTEALARLLDTMAHPGRPRRGLVEAGLLGARLAQARGLQTQDVQLAVLLGAIGGLEGDLYETAPEDLPASLALALRHLEERWDGTGGPDGLAGSAIPLESRLAALALAVSRGEPLREGRFDPQCVALLGRLQPDHLTVRKRGQVLRGLLSLGRALEEAGDGQGAAHAYQEIALSEQPSSEFVEAHLGLARLSRDPSELARHAQKATEAASFLGPWARARALLRAGKELCRRGQVGGPLLENACQLFRQLRDAAGEAQALLAAHVLGKFEGSVEEALQTMLAPQNAWHLAADASWLLPYLLERQGTHPDPVLARALTGLARDAPREFEARLAHLDVPARMAAAGALAEAGGPVAERLLLALASDPAPEVRAEADAARRRQLGTHTPPVLRIFTLGPLEVFKGEDRVPDKSWRSQKMRFVFAYLAAAKAQPVAEDLLIDAFWTDDFEKGRRNLYWCSSMLRSLLRPEGWPADLDYILRSGGCLQLNPELPRWHDLEELEREFEEGLRLRDAGQMAPAVEAFRRAVALYRAPFLEASYLDWTDPIRTRVSERVLEALTFLLQGSAEEQRYQESLDYAQRILALDPCRQEACQGAMEALLAMNRREEAVRCFEGFRKTLRDELGLDVSPSLTALRQRCQA